VWITDVGVTGKTDDGISQGISIDGFASSMMLARPTNAVESEWISRFSYNKISQDVEIVVDEKPDRRLKCHRVNRESSSTPTWYEEETS
jgi:hypothetical protein